MLVWSTRQRNGQGYRSFTADICTQYDGFSVDMSCLCLSGVQGKVIDRGEGSFTADICTQNHGYSVDI